MDDILTAIEGLKETVAGFTSGTDTGPYIGGHGIQSRRFLFSWRDDALTIDFDLPCLRVLSGEDAQNADHEEIVAACRMGILLLAAHNAGALLHPDEGEAALEASCNEDGTRYALRDAEGKTLDEGTDWSVLAARLETAFADAHAEGNSIPMIIWP